jgi:hypothetical protein
MERNLSENYTCPEIGKTLVTKLKRLFIDDLNIFTWET